MQGYKGHFRSQQGCLSLTHSFEVTVTPNLGLRMFGVKKLETSFHDMMQSIYRYIELFRRDLPVCRTDGQTERQQMSRLI